MALIAGCVTKAPDVVSYRDPNSGSRTDLISENLLESPGTPRELVWLNASRVFKNSRDYQYYLEVDYMARPETGFLDIQPGETLVITADGETWRLSGSGSLNTRREAKEEVRERAIYPATGHQLRLMASAQAVRVGVIGRNGIVQREFAAANFDRFRQFVSKFVPEA